MRKMWWAAAAVLMCAPLGAAAEQGEQDQKQVYLVIDEAIQELQGQVYGSAYGVPIQMGTTDRIDVEVQTPYVYSSPTPAGLSYAQAAGAGLVGGLIAGAIIDSAAQSARNGEIESLRQILDDGVLRKVVLGAASSSFETAGHPLARRIIARNPDERLIKRAIGRERPEEVILFDSQDLPLVLLSRDNRRVMVQAQISLYLHEDGRDYDLEREHQVAFVSPPSPEGVDPLAYWAHDEGSRVLEAVGLGIRHLVAAATAEATREAAELEEKEHVELMLDGQRVAIHGRHLAQHGDYAYLVTPHDWIRVWPAAPAPAVVTEPGTGAVPAAESSAPQ